MDFDETDIDLGCHSYRLKKIDDIQNILIERENKRSELARKTIEGLIILTRLT